MKTVSMALDVMPEFGHFSLQSSPPGHLHWRQDDKWWSMIMTTTEGVLTVEGEPVPFPAGSVLIVQPGVEAELTYLQQHTQNQFWGNFSPRISVNSEVALPQVAILGETACALMTMLEAGWIDAMALPMALSSLLWAILWHVAKPGSKATKSATMQKAESFVENNLGQTIRVQDLADECGLSHHHLIRLFRQEHGVTPLEFIRDKRVQLACKLLLSTTKTIKSVAIEVGINDLQRFNKTIRDAFGCSPRKLRQLKTTPDVLQWKTGPAIDALTLDNEEE